MAEVVEYTPGSIIPIDGTGTAPVHEFSIEPREALPEAAFSVTIKAGAGFEAPMLTIRGQHSEEFFNRVGKVEDHLNLPRGTFLGPFGRLTGPVEQVVQAFPGATVIDAPAQGTVSPPIVTQPTTTTGTDVSNVRGYGEPCPVCNKFMTKIIHPKPGQQWSPFAGCDVWDDAHKAAAKK